MNVFKLRDKIRLQLELYLYFEGSMIMGLKQLSLK